MFDATTLSISNLRTEQKQIEASEQVGREDWREPCGKKRGMTTCRSRLARGRRIRGRRESRVDKVEMDVDGDAHDAGLPPDRESRNTPEAGKDHRTESFIGV